MFGKVVGQAQKAQGQVVRPNIDWRHIGEKCENFKVNRKIDKAERFYRAEARYEPLTSMNAMRDEVAGQT
jgi:hypothetical protein